MVRLVLTDFATKEDNEAFYLNDEFDVSVNMFTYDSLKKYSVYLSKYEINDEIYSLNLLSKKHLLANQFLVHITDGEFMILFNHKTVYSAKISQNFITDDMIKSILITRHIAMLSSGGDIDKVYYIVNSKYKSAIENILKQNTRNEKNEIIAERLGNAEELVKILNPLDTYKSHILKNTFIVGFVASLLWIMFFGLNILENQLMNKESLSKLKREIRIEKRLVNKQKISLRQTMNSYKNLAECISPNEVK